jgi:hypothetical protein
MAEPPQMRIGNVERDAAMKALNDHMSAGRLGVEEYADRSAQAANATTAAELRALFTDLPAPHPALPDGVALAKPAAAVPAPAPSGEVEQRKQGFIDSWGGRFVAATPILALIIFAASGWTWWWIWFLIPLAGAVFYGSNEERHREREDRRRDHRDRRDDRRR